MEDLKFGDLVKVRTQRFVISKEKLKELKAKYGVCVSKNQMYNITNSNYDNCIDLDYLKIEYIDLEIQETKYDIYLILQKNLFGYRGALYSEHYKYENYFNGYDFIQIIEDKPHIRIDKIGIEFQEFSIWSVPQVIEHLGDTSFISCKFFNKINK